MTANPCEICQGAKRARLPRYRPLAAYDAREVPTIEPLERAYMEIACPECTDKQADDNRLTVLHSDATVTTHTGKPPEIVIDAVKQTIANALAHELLRRNLISFNTVGETYRTRVIGTIAAVAPSHVATMEERINQATFPALETFAGLAADRISIWGRDVGRSTITKDEAVRFINETLREWRDGKQDRTRR